MEPADSTTASSTASSVTPPVPAGSDSATDRLTDPPDSSDCSNHSTTDKDSEVSDSDSRHAKLDRRSAAGYRVPVGPALSSGAANPFGAAARTAADAGHQEPRRSVLAPSRLAAATGSPTAGTGGAVSAAGRPILRPSALAATGGAAALLKPPEANGLATSSFTLNPPKFNNPFASPKSDSTAETSSSSAGTDSLAGAGVSSGETCTDAEAVSTPAVTRNGSNGASEVSSTTTPPVGSSSSSSAVPSVGSPVFIFGQNLEERVTNAATAGITPENGDGAAPAAAAATAASPQQQLPDDEEFGDLPTEAAVEGATAAVTSLLEAAEQYEKQHCVKRKYDEVEVLTGEEDETNVLQVNCKLYLFDKLKCNWLERGRGLLRLNDRHPAGQPQMALQSRLVFRTQGSLRLALNTKLWPGMNAEKPSPRDVRVTAMDGEQVKVFLIKCSIKDAELLHNALDWRLAALRASAPESDDQGDVPPPLTSIAADTQSDCGSPVKKHKPDSPEGQHG